MTERKQKGEAFRKSTSRSGVDHGADVLERGHRDRRLSSKWFGKRESVCATKSFRRHMDSQWRFVGVRRGLSYADSALAAQSSHRDAKTSKTCRDLGLLGVIAILRKRDNLSCGSGARDNSSRLRGELILMSAWN